MANPGSDAPAQLGSAAGSGSEPGSRSSIAVVAGTSCETRGTQITKAGDSVFKLAGTTLRGEYMHGCGCPTGPLFTLVYEVASPLEVRICFDQSKDTCKMACSDVSFDLAQVLGAAKATDVTFVD